MSRTRIPLSECGLLSRANARRYCGCLGDERFDREVGPHVRARLLGSERFYSRKELDAWIDGTLGDDREAFLEQLHRVFAADAASIAEKDRAILATLRKTKRPCSARELSQRILLDQGKDLSDPRVLKDEELEVRARLRGLLEEGAIGRVDAIGNGHVRWEIEQHDDCT